MLTRIVARLSLLVCSALLTSQDSTAGANPQFGFARKDVTPESPLRLSGYGSRATPSEGVDAPLYVRVMAMRDDDGPVHVLLSLDSIGFPATFTQEILTAVDKTHGLSRARLAVCATHSHTTPHLATGLDNLFATPLTEEEQAAAEAYTDQLREASIASVGDAIADLAPGRLFQLQGAATFARNRRVLNNGVWAGFGENPDGPVDHSLPVLAITEPDGKTLRGLVFNYACHCTTFGGEHNRVNGDWAGYAAEYLEAEHPGTVALCTIGCGADQNPERDRQRALDIAQIQGREIAEETKRLLSDSTRQEIYSGPTASFGYAGLPVDRPSIDDLKQALDDRRPQVRRHAKEMLAIHDRMGRLPESYPMPIQVWRFDDQFAMVFLGGEVCVDYAHRISRELSPKLGGDKQQQTELNPVWVTAYANDIFGYVASERMRDEGGYEVDYSMIYYMQPGRWSSGTEDVILRRMHELFEQQGGGEPLSVKNALKAFTLPDEYEIELVASEPLVRDPVNMAVDSQGRLWVVEMGDYPRGAPNQSGWSPEPAPAGTPWDGPPGGRINFLTDTDGDGEYDTATTFLDSLSFPTGVFPWRDGVLVSCAPDIFFARDDDGDGRADHREVLYTGFEERNPQHRVNGFEWGLDGWLYVAGGGPNERVTCTRTGETVDVSRRDLRIHPDTNRIEPVSGHSQCGRCRDDYGNWYGNTNSEPLFQYVIEDPHLQRNPFVASPSPRSFLTDPPRAPRVYPTSRTLDRFNDLYAADRFTSACSPQVMRDLTFGTDAVNSVFICEPVHNLVSRVQVQHDVVPFSAARHPSEQETDFLTTTDPWCRPVRLMTGPDGGLWVCDMYRQVIEHPQWIPEAWQARLNLSAGWDRGRIYRIRRTDVAPRVIPHLAELSDRELVAQLRDPNGWRRDTAQRLLMERSETLSEEVIAAVRELACQGRAAATRTQALWTLVGLRPETRTDPSLINVLLRDEYSENLIQGIRALSLDPPPNWPWVSATITSHPAFRVRYELALAAGAMSDDSARRSILTDLAVQDVGHPWMRTAVLSSARKDAADILTEVLASLPPSEARASLVDGLIATTLGNDPRRGAAAVLSAVTPAQNQSVESWQVAALAKCLDVLSRRKQSLDALRNREEAWIHETLPRVDQVITAGRQLAADESADVAVRQAATQLLGQSESHRAPDLAKLAELLNPRQPPEVQSAAIKRLADLRDAETLISHLTRVAPRQQAAIEAVLLTHNDLVQKLLTSLSNESIAPSQLSAATRSALINHHVRSIREPATNLLGEGASTVAAEIGARKEMVTALSGDITRGRAVFEKRCSTCHRHHGIGVDVGPKLGALQNKSTEYLLTSILDANRSVEPKYRSCVLLLADGRQQTGLIAEETATSVTLMTADGKRHSLLRNEIEELILSRLSFMPDGLGKDLTDQNLADVIAFLQQGE